MRALLCKTWTEVHHLGIVLGVNRFYKTSQKKEDAEGNVSGNRGNSKGAILSKSYFEPNLFELVSLSVQKLNS